MKITKKKLENIIKEETRRVLLELGIAADMLGLRNRPRDKITVDQLDAKLKDLPIADNIEALMSSKLQKPLQDNLPIIKQLIEKAGSAVDNRALERIYGWLGYWFAREVEGFHSTPEHAFDKDIPVKLQEFPKFLKDMVYFLTNGKSDDEKPLKSNPKIHRNLLYYKVYAKGARIALSRYPEQPASEDEQKP